MLRSGEEESSRSTRPRTNFFLRWMGCTETSSPGRTKGTKTACPSWCARPSPPYTSFSMRTSMTNGMSPRPPRTRPPAALDHVEQAQPRQSESFEQAFLQILPLDLRELCRRHLPPVGSELAVEFSARRNQRLFAGASRSRCRKFFFQCREAPLEILQIERRGGIEEHANFLEPCADFADSQCQLRLPFPLFVRCRRQFLSVALHIRAQFFSRKRLRPGSRYRGRRNVRPASRRCLLGFLGGIEHRVHAIHQAFQRPPSRSAPRALITLERPVNPFQHGRQRNPRLLPGFHDGPVERRDEQVRAALLPEIFFDFGEVAVGIHRTRRARRVHRRGFRGTAAGPAEPGAAVASALGLGVCHAGLRSQMMRSPSSVKNSSMVPMWREAPPINGACPPVAITFVSGPRTFFMRSRMPSTRSV